MTKSKISGSGGWPLLALALLAGVRRLPRRRHWQDARMKRSAEGYEQFLEQLSRGPVQRPTPGKRWRRLRFKQVQKENTLDAFEGIPGVAPRGPARRGGHGRRWRCCAGSRRSGRTRGRSFEGFLEAYPEGRFADDARERLAPFLLAGLGRSRDPVRLRGVPEDATPKVRRRTGPGPCSSG